MSNPRAAAFYAANRAAIERASKATGIPAKTIAVQWAHESGYGSAPLAKEWNLAGIRRGGAWAHYSTLDEFTDDYIRAANQDRYNAARTSDPAAAAAGLGAGGWDAAGYIGTGTLAKPGGLLLPYFAADAALLASTFPAPLSPTTPAPPTTTTTTPPGSSGSSGGGGGGSFGDSGGGGGIGSIDGWKLTPIGPLPKAVPIPGIGADTAGGIVSGAAGLADGAGKALGFLTTASNWKRIGLGLGGAVLVVLAVSLYGRQVAASTAVSALTSKGSR